jgi:hypothetical protein
MVVMVMVIARRSLEPDRAVIGLVDVLREAGATSL